ncbi:MAG: hypothetical protein GXO37_06700 [Chloroflexi bacterium]|nr:hypothetical protein [Chloroflexota bacterium]
MFVMQEVDVQDTPYMAHLCGRNKDGHEVWAIYCTEHQVVFPVEVWEDGPLYAVPWDEVTLEELPKDIRDSVELYATYKNAHIDAEGGCTH